MHPDQFSDEKEYDDREVLSVLAPTISEWEADVRASGESSRTLLNDYSGPASTTTNRRLRNAARFNNE